ncbi:MAG: ABC transporter substrate-binding protein [Rhodospirillales bacterium]
MNRGINHGRGAFAAAAAALALAFAATTAAADTKRTPQLEQLLKDAQAEGQINVMWGISLGQEQGARDIENALNKTFGLKIKVNYTPGPSMPQLATRTIQEVKAGQKPSTDLYVGVEVSIPAMITNDVLLPVKWSEYFPEITPEMQTKGGHAVHIVTLFNGVTYNTQFVKKNEVPKMIADMFNPKWKKKIASTPYAAAFDRLALARGYDVMEPIVKKTAEWTGGLIRCGEYERLASGEFVMLFLDCGRVDDALAVEKGGPLDQTLLGDALATTLWYFAVPKTSPSPNLAKLFAGFVATKAGQDIIGKYGNATSHLVPGTENYKVAKEYEAKGMKILSLTADDIQPREADLAKYKKAFQDMLVKK